MTHDEAREILRQCRVTLLDAYIDQQEAAERESCEAMRIGLELNDALLKRAETAEQEVERLRGEFVAMCSDAFRLPAPKGKAPEDWAREQAKRMSRNFDAEIAEHQRHHDEEEKLVEQARAESYERGKRDGHRQGKADTEQPKCGTCGRLLWKTCSVCD